MVACSWILTLMSAGAMAQPAPDRGLDEDRKAKAIAGAPTYRALLFSAQDYPRASGLSPLTTPEASVARLEEVLTEQYGFEVEVFEEATRSDVIGALDGRTSGEESEALLIYYAGHGRFSDDEQRGYWLPAGAEAGNSAGWVSNDDIAAKLRAMPSRHVLLVADAWFSSGARIAERPDASAREIAELLGQRSRWVIASGSAAPVASGGQDGLSVFTWHLTEALADSEQATVVPDAFFVDLRARLRQAGAPAPQQGPFGGTFHEDGQLVMFNGAAAERAPAVAVAAPVAEATQVDSSLSRATAGPIGPLRSVGSGARYVSVLDERAGTLPPLTLTRRGLMDRAATVSALCSVSVRKVRRRRAASIVAGTVAIAGGAGLVLSTLENEQALGIASAALMVGGGVTLGNLQRSGPRAMTSVVACGEQAPR